MRSLRRDGETDSPLALWLVVLMFIFLIENEKIMVRKIIVQI